MNAADTFAALDLATEALKALTPDTPADERARTEAAFRAASDAMFDLL